MTAGDHRRGGSDPYSTLGVGTDASDEEITRAYRRLARDQHPDTNPDAHDGDFAGLTDAYDVLRDPDRRRRYDQTRDTRVAAARAAAAPRVPVHTIEANRPTPNDRGASRVQAAEVDLELTFDQAALGTTATVTLAGETPCAACAGRGAATSACSVCGGLGATSRRSGGITIRTACATCGGTGRGQPARCGACSGAGTTTTTRELAVRVPSGVEDGTRLRLPPTDSFGTVDAIVRVGAHPFFERRGLDVTIRLPVTLAEAALGAVVTVPTLDGAVTIRVPAGTPHGRVLRVAGRGIANASRAGDLLVTVAIHVPAALNDRQRSALESYAEATTSPRRHLEGHRRAGSTDHPHEAQGGGP